MHQDLIFQFLKAISQNQDISSLLVKHLDKFDNTFASELREFANQKFVSQPSKAVAIAKIIVELSKRIQQFISGNTASNLEIAIAGYESALKILTYEAFPRDWAGIQQHLINAYQQRQDILSQTIIELKENTFQNQIQINDLTEKFHQEKQQSSELKVQLLQAIESQTKAVPAIDLQPIVSAIQATKSPLPNFNTVILYDIENLTLGSNNPQFPFSLKEITENIKRYNLVDKIAGQYAYADWSNSRLHRIRKNIQELGIEPMQIFGFSNHKNAADIQLVIDAVELIHSKPSLEVFAIVSGDGGFSCLAKKLHEYGKIVIGCAYNNHTNKLLPAVCDYFVRLPDPVNYRNEVNHPSSTVEPPQLRNRYQEVLNYLRNNQPYRSDLRQDGVDLSVVRKLCKEQISDFDYQELNFKKFKSFLKSIIQDTEFEIVHSGSNNSIAKLKLN
ncbi:MAG: NYN domain-containing protein [Rivularia sp. (in: Bacteria)]|nr:NYN domain-containing protein [Rivularia sp. MS3]